MSTHDRNRVPAGVTTGGQFATSPRTEANVWLRNSPTPTVDDTRALDLIVAHLGTAEEWDTGDDLSYVADTIARTGRPHPGDANEENYRTALAAWTNANPAPQGATDAMDWNTLNGMALGLASQESWDAEMLEYVADGVAASGRPHPGDSRTLREFDLAMEASRRDRGLEPDLPAGTRKIAQGAGVPVVHDILGIVHGREDVTDAQFTTVTVEDATRWHEQLIGPAADYMADQIRATEPPKDHPYLDNDDEAWEHVRDCAQDAGISSAAEVIWMRYESGDLNAADLESLTPELVGDMYERHLGPAVDEIEAELRSR